MSELARAFAALNNPYEQRQALENYGKGYAASIPGQLGDAASLVDALMLAFRPGTVQMHDNPMTTEAIGRQMGADVSSPAFIGGSMGIPGVEDLLKAGTLGHAMAFAFKGGKGVGYKVMRVDKDGRLISGANSRLSFNGKPGDVIEMPGQGVFISDNPKYVTDYYGGLADDEVLLKVGFNESDIKAGNPFDREPEIGVSKVRVIDRTPLVDGEPVPRGAKGN